MNDVKEHPWCRRMAVGFMFSADRQYVALIRKTKPKWQAGKLNGIGGKCEVGERPLPAMVREFREETGCETTESEWKYRLQMGGCDASVVPHQRWQVDVFVAFSDKVFNLMSPTEEQVTVVNVALMHEYPLIPNLAWLIPLLLDDEPKGGYVQY